MTSDRGSKTEEKYLIEVENSLMGEEISDALRKVFRKEVVDEYASDTLNQIFLDKKSITETKQYQSLFERCIYNVKENIFDSLIENESFRRAIKDYGTKEFDKYDKKLQHDVPLLMKNLQEKFNYTSESAKQICFYALDNDLPLRFGGIIE